VIFPREPMLKHSLPTSAPFFAEWLSRRGTAHRANNFWRPADWQYERGLQHLLRRILKTVQEGLKDRDERLEKPPVRTFSVHLSTLGLRRDLHGSVKQIHHEDLEDGDEERPSAFRKIMLKETDSGVQQLHGAGERTQDQHAGVTCL
jgi:hypothetical protein